MAGSLSQSHEVARHLLTGRNVFLFLGRNNYLGNAVGNSLSSLLDIGYGLTVHCRNCTRARMLQRKDMEELIARRGPDAEPAVNWFRCSGCGKRPNELHLRLLMYDPGELKGPPLPHN